MNSSGLISSSYSFLEIFEMCISKPDPLKNYKELIKSFICSESFVNDIAIDNNT